MLSTMVLPILAIKVPHLLVIAEAAFVCTSMVLTGLITTASFYGDKLPASATPPLYNGTLPHFVAGVDPTATAYQLLFTPWQDNFTASYFSSDDAVASTTNDRFGIWRAIANTLGRNSLSYWVSLLTGGLVTMMHATGILSILHMVLVSVPARFLHSLVAGPGAQPTHVPAGYLGIVWTLVSASFSTWWQFLPLWRKNVMKRVAVATAVVPQDMPDGSVKRECRRYLKHLERASRSFKQHHLDVACKAYDAIRSNLHNYRRIFVDGLRYIAVPFKANGCETPAIGNMVLAIQEAAFLKSTPSDSLMVDLFNAKTGERAHTIRSIGLSALRYLNIEGVVSRSRLTPQPKSEDSSSSSASSASSASSSRPPPKSKRGKKAQASSAGSVTHITVAPSSNLRANLLETLAELGIDPDMLREIQLQKQQKQRDKLATHTATPAASRSSSVNSQRSGAAPAADAANDNDTTSGVRPPRAQEIEDKPSKKQPSRGASTSSNKRRTINDDEGSSNSDERATAPADNKSSRTRSRSASSARSESSVASKNSETAEIALTAQRKRKQPGKTSGGKTSTVFFVGRHPLRAPKDTCAAQSVVVALHGVAGALQGAISKESDLAQFRKASSAAENGTATVLRDSGNTKRAGQAMDADRILYKLFSKYCVSEGNSADITVHDAIATGRGLPRECRPVAVMLYDRARRHWTAALPAQPRQLGSNTEWELAEGNAQEVVYATYKELREKFECTFLWIRRPQDAKRGKTTAGKGGKRKATSATNNEAAALPAVAAAPVVAINMTKCGKCDKTAAEHASNTAIQCKKCSKIYIGECGATTTAANLLSSDSGDHMCDKCAARVDRHQEPPTSIMAEISADLPPAGAAAAAAAAAGDNVIRSEYVTRYQARHRLAPGSPQLKIAEEVLTNADGSCAMRNPFPASSAIPRGGLAHPSGQMALAGRDLLELQLAETIEQSNSSKLAIYGKAASVRRFNLKALKELRNTIRRTPEMFDQNLARCAVHHLRMKMLAAKTPWQPQTFQRHLHNIIGALNALPLYSNAKTLVSLKLDAELKATLDRLKLISAEAQPTNQVATTWEDISAAMAKTDSVTVKLHLLLMWLGALRSGDSAGLKRGDLSFAPATGFLDVTVSEGKGILMRKGKYSVHTVVPEEFRSMLDAHLKTLAGPQSYVFQSLRKGDAHTRLANACLTSVRPRLTTRSIRRGSLQAMAMGVVTGTPVPLATLMDLAGHTQESTTKRYLDWGRLFGESALAQREAVRNLRP